MSRDSENPPGYPWRGIPPKFRAITKTGDGGFAIRAQLASGEEVMMPLAAGATFQRLIPKWFEGGSYP